MNSALERQLEEYFVALETRISEPTPSPLACPEEPHRPRRGAALLAAGATVAVLGLGVAALWPGGDETDEVTTGPVVPVTESPASTPPSSTMTDPPSAPQECSTLYSAWSIVYLFDVEPRCYLAAEAQALRLWNKGYETMQVELPGGPIEVGVDSYIDTPVLGEWLGLGDHVIAVTPYGDVTVTVVAADSSATGLMTFDHESMGPFELGAPIDDLVATSDLPLDTLTDQHPVEQCYPFAVVGDPFSPYLHPADPRDGSQRFLRSISVGRSTQLGPDGIAVGMSSAELRARNGEVWQEAPHPLAGAPLRTALAWSVAEDRQIMAILDDDRVVQFIIRDPATPIKPPPPIAGEPGARNCFQ